MDGEKRKRKERDDDDDDDDEGEEKKMEKFFALIRSTRQVRKLIMSTSDKSELPDRLKNINVTNEEKLAPAGPWIPVFRPEDFIEDGGPAIVLDQADQSTREGKNKEGEEEDKEEDEEGEGEGDEREKDDDDGGLDLKLSL